MNQPQNNQDEQIKKLQQKAEEYLNGWKRAKADYINYKKEVDKNQMELVQFANAALLSQILPIIENYKKALSEGKALGFAFSAKLEVSDRAPAGGDWFKGLENISKQFDDFLKQLGIEQIKTIGEKFNPELHEAVSRKKASAPSGSARGEEGKEADIILEEVKAGYKLHGKVVQVAKVVVSE